MRSPSEPLHPRPVVTATMKWQPHADVSDIALFVVHDSESKVGSQLTLSSFSFFSAAQPGKAPCDRWWQTVFAQECGPNHEQTRQARPAARCKHWRSGACDQPDSNASTSLRDAHRCDRPGTPDISAMLCFVRGGY